MRERRKENSDMQMHMREKRIRERKWIWILSPRFAGQLPPLSWAQRKIVLSFSQQFQLWAAVLECCMCGLWIGIEFLLEFFIYLGLSSGLLSACHKICLIFLFRFFDFFSSQCETMKKPGKKKWSFEGEKKWRRAAKLFKTIKPELIHVHHLNVA